MGTDNIPPFHYNQFFVCDFPEIQKYQNDIYIVYASTMSEYSFLNRNTHGILQEIRNARNNGKTKIIFWNNAETFVNNYVHKIQRIAELLSNEIPKKDLIFTLGSPYGQKFYDNLCDLHGWPNVLSVVSCDHFEKNIIEEQKFVDQFMEKEYRIKEKQKLFVCFNKVHRKHRLHLLAEAIRNGWLNKSYYSFEGHNADWYNKHLGVNEEDCKTILSIKDQYPLRLNITDKRNNPTNIHPDDISYFTNSYFSIITETIMVPSSFNDMYDHMDSLFLSEKIYKPIALMHPFIVFGQSGVLRYLRECGYKTFHPYINESYDDEPDYQIRFNTLITEIKRLEKFTVDEWMQWQKNIKPIVEYNAKYLRNAHKRINRQMINLFE